MEKHQLSKPELESAKDVMRAFSGHRKFNKGTLQRFIPRAKICSIALCSRFHPSYLNCAFPNL